MFFTQVSLLPRPQCWTSRLYGTHFGCPGVLNIHLQKPTFLWLHVTTGILATMRNSNTDTNFTPSSEISAW